MNHNIQPTTPTTTSYAVWAIGKKRDWLRYEGEERETALKAYDKAKSDPKWADLYIEVNGRTTRYTAETLPQ